MMKKLILLLMAMCLVGSAGAADIRYHGSGPWEWLEGVGQTEGWQSTAVPGTADTARANWGGNTVTLDYTAPTIRRFQLGVDESGEFHVLNGGTINTWDGSKVGNNGSCTGTLTIDAGGTVNVGGWMMVAGSTSTTPIGIVNCSGDLNMTGHLWTSVGTGSSATIDINSGGVISVGGIIGLGSVDFGAAGGPTALNINDGGLLALTNIHGDGSSSIKNGSTMNLYGSGIVTLPGDFESVIATYAAAGLITGDGIAGNVMTDLTTNPGFTTVMVPEPASMALLALGALALVRRKK